MNLCKIMLINTTAGKKYLLCTYSKSKEFKTLKGAENWAKKNNYKIERIDL